MNWGPDKEIIFFPVAEKCKNGTHTYNIRLERWLNSVCENSIDNVPWWGGRKAIFLIQNRDCINYRRLLNVTRSYYQLTGEAVARLRDEGLDRRITINVWLRFHITVAQGFRWLREPEWSKDPRSACRVEAISLYTDNTILYLGPPATGARGICTRG